MMNTIIINIRKNVFTTKICEYKIKSVRRCFKKKKKNGWIKKHKIYNKAWVLKVNRFFIPSEI